MKLKINEIMTKDLVTIKDFEALEQGYIKMKTNGIRHLPVTNDKLEVVGIISDRDIQRAMMCFGEGDFNFDTDEVIADYMSTDLKTVPDSTELLVVIQKMLEFQISSVLISKDDQLAGIITHEDLLLVLAEFLKPKEGAADKIQNWIYKTPISEVAQKIANIGI